MKNQRMQMSVVALLCAIVSLLISTTTALAQANVVVYKSVVPNGSATNATTLTTSVLKVNAAGATALKNFGVAYEILFRHPSTGVPINVQNFKVTSATHTLQKEGVDTNWLNVPAGAYNPPGDLSKPDFVTRDANGAQTSVNLTQVVGTTVPSVHKFQILDFNVPLGTTARPYLVFPGNNYELIRNITFEYRYLGVLYTKTLAESVKVEVISVGLQVSEDLENWYPVDIEEVPIILPMSVSEVISLLPASETVPGLVGNKKRFYRFSFPPSGSPET